MSACIVSAWRIIVWETIDDLVFCVYSEQNITAEFFIAEFQLFLKHEIKKFTKQNYPLYDILYMYMYFNY